MNKGILYGLLAYGLWGFFPIYWKLIDEVPATQIFSHRIIWSFIFLMMIIFVRRDLLAFRTAIKDKRIIVIYMGAALLISVNWLTYIWGVNAGFIVETSLGYFINPLVNVLLGVVFLREKLRPMQWIPVGLAFAGVLYLTLNYGALPWIALVLAFSFGLYGLIKKAAPLNSLHSVSFETGMLFFPAVLFLIYAESQGNGSFGHTAGITTLLLVFTGIVTALPLLLFANAARMINLSTLGILQYLAPTIQFLIGVFLYGEPLTASRLIGFAFIWTALILYSLENIYMRRRSTLSLPV
jgi:chloramphenicol-sensitive protein RarD